MFASRRSALQRIIPSRSAIRPPAGGTDSNIGHGGSDAFPCPRTCSAVGIFIGATGFVADAERGWRASSLGMHLTQVAPTGCYLERSNLEGLAMWA